MNKWTTIKPEFKKECLLITANKFGKEYEYSFWEIKKIHTDKGYYMGLLTSDGYEYGALEDLFAEKYLMLKLLK